MTTPATRKPFPALFRLMLATGASVLTFGAACCAAGVANAYEAFVTQSAPLEAGPSPDYPQVAELDSGAPVTVYGCVAGYEWCDVSFNGNRGWFDAQLLAVPYQDQRVPIFDYGVQIGLPVVGFSFDDYWGRYYHDRPFFGERQRYVNIAPPAPRPHGGRPGFTPGRGPGHGPGPVPRPEQRPAAAPHPAPAHAPPPHPEAQRPQPPRPAPQAARPPEHPPEARPAEHAPEHSEEHHE